MDARRLRSNDIGAEVRLGRMARPRPNRLSDEAIPNVLTGSDEASKSNAGPSWVRAGAAGRRAAASQGRSGQPAARTGRPQVARAGPNWMTVAIIGFFLLSIARACLQGG